MENLKLYNDVRAVPKEALKEILGGKLKGKSDINPMWRIKTLTENFGPCGIGWYYEITNQWLEQGSNGEVAGFCNINLYYKYGEQWSRPIPGTGGSSFISKTKNGMEISDEVYKMALTDAISVACKALGFGADVYWATDRTKYDKQTEVAQQAEVKQPATPAKPAQATSEDEINKILAEIRSTTNKAELTAKWKQYKDKDKAYGNKILQAVNEMGDKLGLTKNGKA